MANSRYSDPSVRVITAIAIRAATLSAASAKISIQAPLPMNAPSPLRGGRQSFLSSLCIISDKRKAGASNEDSGPLLSCPPSRCPRPSSFRKSSSLSQRLLKIGWHTRRGGFFQYLSRGRSHPGRGLCLVPPGQFSFSAEFLLTLVLPHQDFCFRTGL
jgi:hypothetical protein